MIENSPLGNSQGFWLGGDGSEGHGHDLASQLAYHVELLSGHPVLDHVEVNDDGCIVGAHLLKQLLAQVLVVEHRTPCGQLGNAILGVLAAGRELAIECFYPGSKIVCGVNKPIKILNALIKTVHDC